MQKNISTFGLAIIFMLHLKKSYNWSGFGINIGTFARKLLKVYCFKNLNLINSRTFEKNHFVSKTFNLEILKSETSWSE